tara:strand:- start:53 stop:649 length:597 start_codon:yes stop_codon:yes gene_type:complete
MTKNPIQHVTSKLQYRAIGIVNGIYVPHEQDHLHKGTLIDNEGKKIEAVVLGKVLSLIKKYVDIKKNHFWIVYPKNKNTQSLHLQIAGLWDPYELNNIAKNNPQKNTSELLEELNLSDNYFSIRGELIFVNTQKNEIIMKICSTPQTKKIKKNNFKLVIAAELSLDLLNSFLSLDVIREGNILRMSKYEIIEKNFSKK